MPLGTEVGLSPGHIVLDEDPAPLPTERGCSPPLFGSCMLPNGHPSQQLLSSCCLLLVHFVKTTTATILTAVYMFHQHEVLLTI